MPEKHYKPKISLIYKWGYVLGEVVNGGSPTITIARFTLCEPGRGKYLSLYSFVAACYLFLPVAYGSSVS